jgi:prephenate dehydrogenase
LIRRLLIMKEGGFQPISVGVIGGKGRMGGFLVKLLEEAGQRPLVMDIADGSFDPERAAECLVLILAVPVQAIEEVMQAIGPYTRADGAVIDIASLKEAPLKAMLAHACGEVVGSHPLFGPSCDPAGQTVFVCQGRGDMWASWWRGLWQRAGANVVEISPSRHDRLMAQVQTLRHLLISSLGLALESLGFDPEEDLPLAGPWFGSLWNLLDNQAAQPAGLYTDLALANPHAAAAVRALGQAVQETGSCLERGDRLNLARLLDRGVAMTVQPKDNQIVDRAAGMG